MNINIRSLIRAYSPELFGIRRALQKSKLKKLHRMILKENIILKAENDPLYKQTIIEAWLSNNKEKYKPLIEEAKNCGGGDAKLQNDIIFCFLAYGFIPSEYVSFNFSSKSVKERNTYISDVETLIFGYSVNNIRALQYLLDKSKMVERYKNYLNRDYALIGKTDFYSFSNFVKKHHSFIKKNIFSSKGQGVEKVVVDNDANLHNLFNSLVNKRKVLLEEIIVQHKIMALFNESSVNTIRVISLKLKNEVVIPWAILRTGRKNEVVDNAGHGGIVAGINIITGIVETDGIDEQGIVYFRHPDSKKAFKGTIIPFFNQLIDICLEIHNKEKELGYLSFDMALNENGYWCVVEVNDVGQLILPQMAYQRGIKKEIYRYNRDMNQYI